MVMCKKTTYLVLFLFLLTLVPLAEAKSNENDCVYYFYGKDCKLCGETETFLENLQIKHPSLQINKYEVYYNKSNLQLLQDYFNAYEISSNKQGVPVVFLSQRYFIGPKSIIDFLENAVTDNEGVSCPSLKGGETLGIIGEKSPRNLIETLTFVSVTGTAFKDSISPFAIAVLLILLGTLLAAINRKRKVLQTGLFFTVAIYFAYFLFGVGLLSVLKLSGISYVLYKVVALIAILIGLSKVKDYFWPKKVLMEIPKKVSSVSNKFLQWITFPVGAFVFGFAVCLFELSCTGGPHQVILGLLADKATQWAAVPWLLYYNLIFILPLIVATLIIHRSVNKIQTHGKEKKDIHGEIEKKKGKNIRLLHLVTGIIMVILGVLVLFV